MQRERERKRQRSTGWTEECETKERGRESDEFSDELAPIVKRVPREVETSIGPDGHVGVGVDIGVPEEEKKKKRGRRGSATSSRLD